MMKRDAERNPKGQRVCIPRNTSQSWLDAEPQHRREGTAAFMSPTEVTAVQGQGGMLSGSKDVFRDKNRSLVLLLETHQRKS